MTDSLINKIKPFTVLVAFTVVFASCNTNTVFTQSITLPTGGWYKNNEVVFNVNIKDTLINYSFNLNIRNTNKYRFNNLYLFLTTKFPNGNVSRDTIECILANKEGKWLGKGWGSVKENDILLKSDLRFPLAGNYKFLIQQAMRVDTLKGIENIGLSIIAADN